MKKGFTLMEIMVVLIILGILAAIAMPMYADYSRKARTSEIPLMLKVGNGQVFLDRKFKTIGVIC